MISIAKTVKVASQVNIRRRLTISHQDLSPQHLCVCVLLVGSVPTVVAHPALRHIKVFLILSLVPFNNYICDAPALRQTGVMLSPHNVQKCPNV